MQKWIIIGVFLLAFLLRTINISNIPAGFTPDEASFGYDAYSLLKTGKDQWGNSWPTTFKSFGDYKLPVYTYLTVPTVAVFGLNEFAVRLPNAIFGTLAVIVTYFLARELFEKSQESRIALFGTIFLAFSPWHIALSRGAFEANLTTFFLTAGVLFFLKSRRKNWYLVVTSFLFGINLFTYHSARVVTPLLFMALLWIYRKDFPTTKKYTFASAVFLFFLVISIASFFQGSGARASTSTLLSQNLGSGVIRANVVNAGMPPILARVFYNEPLYKFTKFTQNYISYFSPSFLRTEGAREVTYGMLPGLPLLTLVEVLGLTLTIVLFRKKEKSVLLLVFWVLVAAIPAAISVGPGHAANRAAVMMPALQLLCALGLTVLFAKVNALKRYSLIIVMAVAFLGLGTLTKYFYQQPVVAEYGMMYGMKETFSFLGESPDSSVILSRSLSEPHIYAAFYDLIDPEMYQRATKGWNFEEQGLQWVDQIEGYKLNRYTVTSIDKIRDFQAEGTLVVGKRTEMPENARILKTILSPAKVELWVIAQKNE